MTAQVWIAIALGMAAVIDDLRRREISNWISAAGLAAGMGWQLWSAGWMGLLYGSGGAVAGFSVFLIFYILGGMGGGDVKLKTGFGALLGAWNVLVAALWIAGVGGILAIGALAYKAVKKVLVGPPPAPLTEDEKVAQESIPYAPAIALGVWLTLVGKS
jgi:prepilin peptidase CpaA